VKTAVIGIGNILFKDEGIGVYTAKFLEENFAFSGDVEVIDGGTLGFKLMRYYQEYEKVIIIDTVSIEDTPGSIYNLPADVLLGLGEYRKTAHEVEVVEMLEICSLLESIAEVNVVGVVPKDIESVEIGLSEEIEKAFEGLYKEVLRELGRVGIEYERKGDVSLRSVVERYATPSMERM